MRSTLRSILVATDLGPGSDVIVNSAGRLAARTGAELHLLHSLEFSQRAVEATGRKAFRAQIDEAEERLRQQVNRTVPEGVSVASSRVIIYAAHRAILERAKEVGADLIVLGPHRGSAVGAHFLGTTADRVIRTADVPCLVVTKLLAERVERIGVPLDFPDVARGALETALAWGLEMDRSGEDAAEDGPEIRVMHVGWSIERFDNPDMEDRVIRPGLARQVEHARSRVPGSDTLDVGIDVLWANKPAEATLRWVEDQQTDLLVMGTRGTAGLKRALIGSMARSIARQSPCPVLLVPRSLWGGRTQEPRLERIVVATDFSESSVQAARWSAEVLAPDAEHLLVHVLEVPEPPSALAGRFGSREELLRTGRKGVEERLRDLRESLEGRRGGDEAAIRTEIRLGPPADEIVGLAEDDDADLLVVGGHGFETRGAWERLGSTAERVIRASATPVLVARGTDRAPPRGILVPVDGSASSLQALAWGRFLSGRFDVPLTALHVETPFIYHYADTIPPSSDPSIAGDEGSDDLAWWVPERQAWLREQADLAGLEPEAVTIRVALGKPADEILAAREREDADLIVMGSRGVGAVGRVFLGSVAGGVLRRTECPVLVVASEADV